jgi:RNA-binding protein YhbY
LHYQTDPADVNRSLETIITATDKIVEIGNNAMNHGMVKEINDKKRSAKANSLTV